MKRAFVALLALLAACGSATPSSSPSARPTPDYGVQEWSGEPDGSNNCGDFAVGWESPEIGGEGPVATLHAIDGENMVLDLKGRDEVEQLTALWCGDVAGDGRYELATQRYTGGAHCCYTIRIDTMDGPTLLERDLGNYGGLDPKDLNDDDVDELIGSSDVLAYFGGLPYAATQPLPLVFTYKSGRYVEATNDFSGVIRKSLAEATDELTLKTGAGDESDSARALALSVFGHYVLLGDQREGLETVDRTAGHRVVSWLRAHADEAAKLVRGEATPAPK